MLRLAWLFICLFAFAAAAQERRPSHCLAIADAAPGLHYLHRAAYDDPVPLGALRITFIDHAMFLIRTPGGTSAITDFAGYLGDTEFVPDAVTMNHAHDTHWTAWPDDRIKHVLRGWQTEHRVDLGDMLIRNVLTDIRGRFGGEAEEDGNSIFVFEAEGLCVGHLGHLHHEPSEEQYAAIGRLDVVMAAVDGGLTLTTDQIVRVMKRLRASVVIPMHWFGRSTLDRFVAGMADEFDVVRLDGPELVISLDKLPGRPTVMVLEPLLPARNFLDD